MAAAEQSAGPAGLGAVRAGTALHPVATLERGELLVSAGLLLALALGLSLATLLTVPGIEPDEAWYANLAQNWIDTGNAWTTIDAGPYPEGRGQSTTLLGAVPSRVAIALWGLDLWSLRLMSFLAGLAVLAATAAVGALLWDWQAGLLAALLLALQTMFVLGSHTNRPEIWLLLAVLLALGASLLGWRRREIRWDMLAAALAVVSVEIHQHGAVFAVGLAATYLARYGRGIWRQPAAWAFGAVGALGGAVIVARQFDWLRGSAGVVGTGHAIPLLADPPFSWPLKEAARYLYYFAHDQLWAVLFGLAIMAALHRRTRGDQIVLAWLAGSALAMMLLVNRMFDLYLLPMLGVGVLLLGRGAADLLANRARWVRKVAMLIVAALFLPQLANAAGSVGRDPLAVQRQLRAQVSCGRVMAPNQYWFAFADCDFRSFDQISHYHHRQGLSFEAAMAAIRPDYLIVDETVEVKLGSDFGDAGTLHGYYVLPRQAYRRFLEERTTLLLTRITPGRGAVQLYRVDWGP